MILRPFSAVKELVENALDAGAGAITVTLGETPDAMLRVDDDGCGMDRDDLLLALEAHATSKLFRRRRPPPSPPLAFGARRFLPSAASRAWKS